MFALEESRVRIISQDGGDKSGRVNDFWDLFAD